MSLWKVLLTVEKSHIGRNFSFYSSRLPGCGGCNCISYLGLLNRVSVRKAIQNAEDGKIEKLQI